jgi:ubiquinol-cytochrome c reductase iron-sulfur subunit
MTAIVRDQVDPKRRRLITALTAGAGAAAGAAVGGTFLYSWFPSRKALAAGAPTEFDLNKVEPGQQLVIEWRGKPVWVVHRTDAMLNELDKLAAAKKLADPESKDSKQPDYAKNAYRAKDKKYLVVLGICTHLGCSPTKFDKGSPAMATEWPGGYVCACHQSQFDMAGRVYAGMPAPKNLEVPPYKIDGSKLVVGLDA